MPIYTYLNEETGEIKDVFQSMNEIHEYQENNKKWVRLYSLPNMAVDSICDPHNPQDYIKATDKKGTLGDLFERSAELSSKRADKEGGRDPIKEAYYEKYSKERKGKKHPDVRKRESKERIKKLGFSIE